MGSGSIRLPDVPLIPGPMSTGIHPYAGDKSGPELAGQRVECVHCRTPFVATASEGGFCCGGCRFVHHLLNQRGLQDFYRYAAGTVPVGSHVFHERDLGWLARLQQAAESDVEPGAEARMMLGIQGISCAGCIWLLEAIFREHPGAVSAEVHAAAGRIRLRWQAGKTDLAAYARDVQRFGYLLGPQEGARKPAGLQPLVRKLGLCGAFALNAMLFTLPHYLGMKATDAFAGLFEVIALGLATASFLVGGPYFFGKALAALRRKTLHIDLPISVGLIFAYFGSVGAWLAGQPSFAYFDFVSIFTFLMLLGRWMQERAIESNRSRLLPARLTPGDVSVLRDGLPKEVPVSELAAGERFTVQRNQLVPVRARLLTGPCDFAYHWINGEPEPRLLQKGSQVAAGARVLGGSPVECVALEDWTTSRLARLMQLTEGTGGAAPGIQLLIRYYLATVLVVAFSGGLMFRGVWQGDWLTAAQVFISVLVVSCPCAIGVALPLLDDLAGTRLQRFGVYLRDGSLWSRIGRVRNILFDKTGTLTLETLALGEPARLHRLTPHTRSILLRMVTESLHPVAASLREALLTMGTDPAVLDGDPPQEFPGCGIEWVAGGAVWRLGRPGWAGDPTGIDRTMLSCDGIGIAGFSFHEDIRPDAASQVESLRMDGFGVALLSGDTTGRVHALAAKLGIPAESAWGELDPEAKAALIGSRWPDNALMLGDGANDSLAFEAALCRGTPAADTGLLEHKADFYMVGRGLKGLRELFRTGNSHRLATRAVFAFALTYNAAAIAASLAGWMNPLVAAIIMPLSSLASIGIVLFILPTRKIRL